jgi:ABC-type sugar transport system, periplasmic component
LKKLKQALCVTLSALVFAGCLGVSSSANQVSSAASTGVPSYMNAVGKFPITKQKITVNAMVGTNTVMAKDWNSMEAFKKLEKLTNIHWNFTYEDSSGGLSSNFLTQLSIRMAGGDMPEVAMLGGMTTDLLDQYSGAGKLVDLTGLIKKYAPHLQNLMNSNTEVRLSMISGDGKIYGLPNYAESSANIPTEDFFDQKYMTNVGIKKVPATTDQLYTMLKAFKTKDMNKDGNKTDDIPMSTQSVGALRQTLQTAFQGYTGGSAGDEWDVNSKGKVVYLPMEKGYKEYLTYCNKLYKEGLLDSSFATQTSSQIQAKMQSGDVGIYLGQTPTVLAGSKIAKDKQICLPPLTSPTNKNKVAQAPNYLTMPTGIITTACKHKEAVMSWFDLFYRTEAQAVDNFCGKTSLLGYEGEQWKYTDATKTKYMFIKPVQNYVQLNQSVIITYSLPGYINNRAVQIGDNLMFDKVEGNKDTKMKYYKPCFPMHARYTKAESDELATITTDLDNYQFMMETKFILGQEPLSNFNAFVSNLSKYGVKKSLAIHQEVYDRYEKNLKK